MKILFLLACVFVFTADISAQVLNPVKWSYSAKKLASDTYEIHLTAVVEEGWHIYSQTTPEGGPVPTAITFTKNPLLSLDGPAKEIGKLEQRLEELFGVEVKQFSNKVDFVQKVKLKGSAKTSVNGTVEFMVCNDEQCLPPSTQKFSIPLK